MEDQLPLLTQILQAIQAMSLLELFATIFSIIYVVLAARESVWCWPFGFLGAVLFFLVCVDPGVRLYSDAVLQVYYAGMSVYGWLAWRKNRLTGSAPSLAITTWPVNKHLAVFAIGMVLAILLRYFWIWMGRDAAFPYIDAMTTSFAVITTYMVARKILENWLYWIVIDVVGIYVYWYQELYLFAFLFVVYTLIAIAGYLSWRKELASNDTVPSQ